MSKEEYATFQIPEDDYDELTAEVKKLGYKNLEQFALEALPKYIKKLKREAK